MSGPAGIDASGIDAAGIEAAGIDAAGIDAAGIDAAGIDAYPVRVVGAAHVGETDRGDRVAVRPLWCTTPLAPNGGVLVAAPLRAAAPFGERAIINGA